MRKKLTKKKTPVKKVTRKTTKKIAKKVAQKVSQKASQKASKKKIVKKTPIRNTVIQKSKSLATIPSKVQQNSDENLFFNRDISWLDFNQRVLHEALDQRTPLLERLRFMSIWRSNNDEFYMKRVGSLFKKIREGSFKPLYDGKGPEEFYKEIRTKVETQKKILTHCFKEEIIPALKQEGITFISWENLSQIEKKSMVDYFKRNIFPILTPLAVDSGHPFPFISNLSKSIGVCLRRPKERTKRFARVKVPTEIPQWVRLKGNQKSEFRFIHIQEIISHNLETLFSGMTIEDSCLFRVTRNAAIDEEGDDAEDKLEWVEEGLKERKFAPVVRLEITARKNSWISQFLMSELDIDADRFYPIDSFPHYTNFGAILDLNKKKLKYKRYQPRIPLFFDHKGNSDFSLFSQIRKRDALVHYPYESFSHSVENFVKTAAGDPKVRAIKIILYRTDTDGRLIDALIEAAENKKQVACIIELKARFDEERNIQWAQKLEEAGIHVSYGLMDLKTHAKMILVVRQDSDAIRTYVNIGTGNFNSQTSKLYTDFGLFTCKKDICDEVLEVFNFLTGRSLRETYKRLLVAPYTMINTFITLINKETATAKAGGQARIIAKMNQLEEPQIIKALYKASQAGVKITLFVRGFCTLRPGIQGMSENIEVFSIVGRLLEHSRIFYFRSGAKRPQKGKFFLGSADWMYRNLFNRVEVIAPIEQLDLCQELWDYLEICSKDNRHLWELQYDGSYIQRVPLSKKDTYNSQVVILKDKA
jgi:polyphosphate kinase